MLLFYLSQILKVFGKYKTFFIESLTLSFWNFTLTPHLFLFKLSAILNTIDIYFSTVFNFLILPLLTIVFILLPAVV